MAGVNERHEQTYLRALAAMGQRLETVGELYTEDEDVAPSPPARRGQQQFRGTRDIPALFQSMVERDAIDLGNGMLFVKNAAFENIAEVVQRSRKPPEPPEKRGLFRRGNVQ